MSEPAPPPDAGNALEHRPETLTPAVIDRVLADFRTWLEELAREPAQTPEAEAEAEEESVDLHTLLGQVIGLRQELNLQTRAVRAQQEQSGEALRHLSQALTVLERGREPERADDAAAEAQRPLLKALVDVYDSLSLAGREARRVQETLAAALGNETGPETGPRLAGLSGWLARHELEQYRRDHEDQWRRQREAADRVRDLLDAMVTGYTMSLRRLDRVLQQHEMEPILTVGQPFDPDLMEAVEVLPADGRPAGEVVDEVRRGYRWRGRVFRYAQVRVAR